MGAPLQPEKKTQSIPQTRFIRTGILVLLCLSAFLYLYRPGQGNIISDQKKLAWDDVAFIDEQGELQLKEWRLEELDKKIKEFEEAEQYALIVKGRWAVYLLCMQ